MGIAATRIQQQQQQHKRNTASSTRTTTNSTDTNQRGTTSNNHNGLYLFYLIHRTWAVVVAETKVSRFTNRKRSNSISSTISSSSSDSSLNSRYSYCSCDYCKNRNDFSDCTRYVFNFMTLNFKQIFITFLVLEMQQWYSLFFHILITYDPKWSWCQFSI